MSELKPAKRAFAAIVDAVDDLVISLYQLFTDLADSVDIHEFRKYERNKAKAVARSRRNNENRR